MLLNLSIHLTCLVSITLEHGLDALPVAAAESVLHAAAGVAAKALVSPVDAFVPPDGRAIQRAVLKDVIHKLLKTMGSCSYILSSKMRSVTSS